MSIALEGVIKGEGEGLKDIVKGLEVEVHDGVAVIEYYKKAGKDPEIIRINASMLKSLGYEVKSEDDLEQFGRLVAYQFLMSLKKKYKFDTSFEEKKIAEIYKENSAFIKNRREFVLNNKELVFSSGAMGAGRDAEVLKGMFNIVDKMRKSGDPRYIEILNLFRMEKAVHQSPQFSYGIYNLFVPASFFIKDDGSYNWENINKARKIFVVENGLSEKVFDDFIAISLKDTLIRADLDSRPNYKSFIINSKKIKKVFGYEQHGYLNLDYMRHQGLLLS